MNPTLSLLLAPIMGRERTYARLLDHLASLRANPAEHDRVCRTLLRKWRLNWENGSRRSCIVDYMYLDGVLKEWSSVHNRGEHEGSIPLIKHLVERLIAVMKDDTNFRADGRMMTAAAAPRTAAMLDELLSRLKALSLAADRPSQGSAA